MKLDQVTFHGVEDIRTALSNLKKMDINDNLKGMLSQADILFKEISPRLLNQLATSHLYRKHIHEHLKFPSKDTTNQVKLLMNQVERDLNHKILTSKRHDTKTKRIKEKGRVMTFYKVNKDQLKIIFDLHNTFLKIQDVLHAGN